MVIKGVRVRKQAPKAQPVIKVVQEPEIKKEEVLIEEPIAKEDSVIESILEKDDFIESLFEKESFIDEKPLNEENHNKPRRKRAQRAPVTSDLLVAESEI